MKNKFKNLINFLKSTRSNSYVSMQNFMVFSIERNQCCPHLWETNSTLSSQIHSFSYPCTVLMCKNLRLYLSYVQEKIT